jgi:hypothetical protein
MKISLLCHCERSEAICLSLRGAVATKQSKKDCRAPQQRGSQRQPSVSTKQNYLNQQTKIIKFEKIRNTEHLKSKVVIKKAK